MRLLTADFIFPVNTSPIKNGFVVVDEQGLILHIGTDAASYSSLTIEKFDGILVPGFINSHCHSELSYLKNKIEPGSGLPQFLKGILDIRNNFSKEVILASIAEGIEEMERNGIVAVADISNDDYSFEAKSKSIIYFHTLLEIFDINPERTQSAFENAQALGLKLEASAPGNCNYSIVPHAPYTVTPQLLKLIDACAYENNSVISIHNQETPSERDMFKTKTGELVDLFATIGNGMDYFKPTGFNSLRSVLVQLPRCNKILLVHNTYTTRADIKWAHAYSKLLFWCFCPNANLYIEKTLPNFEYFIAENGLCCLGTDSLTSNWSLSILDEMKTIFNHAPQIPFEKVLQWATINGARFLGITKKFGSLEVGKKPGINLIENFDFESMSLTSESTVKKIF